jgi:hypothetical protein
MKALASSYIAGHSASLHRSEAWQHAGMVRELNCDLYPRPRVCEAYHEACHEAYYHMHS